MYWGSGSIAPHILILISNIAEAD